MLYYAHKENCLDDQDELGNTLLHRVTHPKQIAKIIKAKGSLNKKNKQGISPLHVIVNKKYSIDNHKCFSTFMKYATLEDISIRDPLGQLPIHLWFKKCLESYLFDSTNLKTLLEIPVVIEGLNLQDGQSKTLLHLALEKQKYDIAIELLNNGASLILPDKNGTTPLHLALTCLNENPNSKLIETICNCLDKDAALYQKDGQSWLVFINSLKESYYTHNLVAVIIKLIKFGVDLSFFVGDSQKAKELETKNPSFYRAIQEAQKILSNPFKEDQVFTFFQKSREEILKKEKNELLWFLSQSKSNQADYQSSFKKYCRETDRPDEDLLLYLFAKSEIDINSNNRKGKTLLHLLLLYIRNHSPQRKMVTWHHLFNSLLEKGASIHIKQNQSTLLHGLLEQELHPRDWPLFQAIMRQSIKQNLLNSQETKNGNTPLLLALKNQHQKSAFTRTVLENGADIMLTNKKGETVFAQAIKNCHNARTLSLIFVEEVLNASDEEGNTWLHYAAYHNNAKAISIFRNRISYTATNDSGETALHVA